MAALLVYAGVKGYKKYQAKKSNLSAGDQNKSRKDRKFISRLGIPSVASANIVPGAEESADDWQPPQYELYEGKASLEPPHYTAPYSPQDVGVPRRTASSPPVMLGITLCESPTTPPSELEGESPVELEGESPFDCGIPDRAELPGDSPVDHISQLTKPAGGEQYLGPMSPAPLHVVKRSSSPLPPPGEEPGMTYSSDEGEDYDENYDSTRRSAYLMVPSSAEELSDFEPPPIPLKSSARKLRVPLS